MRGKKPEAPDADDIHDENIGSVLAEPGTRSLVTRRTLIGPLAEAYEEFRASAAGLEGMQQAYTRAQERYRVALGRFSQLSAAAEAAGNGDVMTTASAVDAAIAR